MDGPGTNLPWMPWDDCTDQYLMNIDAKILSSLVHYRGRILRGTKYYVSSREFDLPELKLLIDSVQASKFLSEKTTSDLIRKMEGLCSRYEAKQLQREVIVSNRVKTTNKSIFYNVDGIHRAIASNLQVQFRYFDYDLQKEKKYFKKGEPYIVSPWRLIYTDDNYYLLAYEEKAGKFKHFRADKMDAVEMKTICFSSVGIPDAKLHMNKIIRKGRQLPYEKSIEIHNTEANITEMCIPVLQGEHSHATKNTIINRIHITNIQPKPVGENTFYMFFSMDKHGSLSIRVVDNDTGNDMKIHDIRYDITDDKIDSMKRNFQNDMKKNEEYLRIAEEKTKAENMIYAILREKPQFDVELTSIKQELTQVETMDQIKFIQAKIQQYM